MNCTDISGNPEMLRFFLLLALLPGFFFSPVHAQTHVSEDDIAFAEYLVRSRSWQDARFFLRQLEQKSDPAHKEHLSWLLGWNAYQAGWQQQSVTALENVRDTHPNFIQSQFLLNYQRMWLSQTRDQPELASLAYTELSELSLSQASQREVQTTLLAGFSLLMHDLPKFHHHASLWSGSFAQFSSHQQALQQIAQDWDPMGQKSPWVAAGLSALVPGLGKWYAGNTGEGIAAFLQVAIPAGIGLESYLKAGELDTRTLIFGAVTALFYTANIYGSYWTVRTAQIDRNDAITQQILFEIHIPVRTLFP